MSMQRIPDDPAKKTLEHDRPNVEMFQSVATFGFLSAAMFCLGGPLILAFAPGLATRFRHAGIVTSGLAGLAVVVCVLVFYCLSVRRALRSGAAGVKSGAQAGTNGGGREHRGSASADGNDFDKK